MIWKTVPRDYGFTKFQLNLPYLGDNTNECFKLWESFIMDQSVTFCKRVHNVGSRDDEENLRLD